MATELTTAAPPNTSDVSATLLAWMAAQSGVVTDYNVGSQVRTLGDGIGSVAEIQAVTNQALAFQAMVYGSFSAYGIFPLGAAGAVGTVTFATSFAPNPPVASQAVLIPQGTIVQTQGGIQFQTTQNATLSQGSVSVNIPVEAVVPGGTGNVYAGAISLLVSNLTYPLSVSNLTTTTGGTNAESPNQTMARFTAKVASIGTSAPVVVANAAIGVVNPGTTEIVQYSTLYEPWVAQQTPTVIGNPGYTLYVDNGSGGASSGLIAAVQAQINGNLATGAHGNRPTGVPYYVLAVVPVLAAITVTGTLLYPNASVQATAAAQAALINFFNTVQFGQTVTLAQINAILANSVGSYLSGFTATMTVGGSSVTQATAGTPGNRVIMQSSNIALS